MAFHSNDSERYRAFSVTLPQRIVPPVENTALALLLGQMIQYLRNWFSPTQKAAIRRLEALLWNPFNWAYCSYYGVVWDSSWIFRGYPHFRTSPGGRITIGRRFCAVSKMRWNSLGVNQPVLIHAFGPSSRISIADDVGMSGCTITAKTTISIGSRVLIGSGALLTDNDGHALQPKDRLISTDIKALPISVEDDVFIGARSIILKGVTIGRGAIVGAGAVVTRDVAPNTIVAGNPAKTVGQI